MAPLFNEEETFPLLVERLTRLLDRMAERVEVVLVDDGSRDATARLMRETSLRDRRFQAVFLSRNFGHQVAVSAGLAAARGSEAVMIIDGDLQDPPELLVEFWAKLQEGYDVVYAVRQKRKESWVKRAAYFSFYRLLKRFAHIDIPLDSGDFCLLRRPVVNALNRMPEESRFLRGMRSWLGFRQIGMAYERDARAAGSPKYSFRKLLQLGLNGIFNFSELPVRFASLAGGVALLLGGGYVGWAVVARVLFGEVPAGFTGILAAIILFGGVQLLFLGILGEYLLRVFFQVKGRPLFLVREHICEGGYADPDGVRAGRDGRGS